MRKTKEFVPYYQRVLDTQRNKEIKEEKINISRQQYRCMYPTPKYRYTDNWELDQD